ncbi:DUF4345 domain-containing protein [Lewinella sp. 4G2]|uniref:DUF4345 domain-containing protein n=1 Tax=Lewinella sp. 4G2 TaxID=1803372 RepID=UPI0018D35FD1|nr:DUF4345 domain-containing protein [Lewinella sp. 4G2]
MKNAQLIISAAIVLSVSLVYGAAPARILPEVFGFSVEDIDLKNIFRAVMGLYWAIGGYWVYAVWKPDHWRNATFVNALFMGGLAVGRTISIVLDGNSPQFLVGLILELILFAWAVLNLTKWYPEPDGRLSAQG